MKVHFLAITIWMFVCMTVFGVFGYGYVLWSQYWQSAIEKKDMINRSPRFAVKSPLLNNKNNYDKDASDSNRNRSLSIPLDKLYSKIRTYRNQLMIQLRKAQLMAGNVLFHRNRKETNIYNVHFKRQNRKIPQKSQSELLCELKEKVKIDFLYKNVEPFKSLGFDKYFPTKKLSEISSYDKCALISSAGSMYKSKLGPEIDSHDVVLRFNSAPTEGFEDDVGTKTTIRILNSQVVSKPEFDFLNSDMYRNITLVAWDPSKYHGSLDEWYKKPDFDIFSPYWMHRQIYPDQPFYILHPDVLWQAWDFIQTNTLVSVDPNPPSSGFIGMILLLDLCNTVSVYEYVPSMRLTKRCHYFDVHEDIGCTLGDWHPLASEKLLSLQLNEGSDEDIFVTGKIILTGFKKLNC